MIKHFLIFCLSATVLSACGDLELNSATSSSQSANSSSLLQGSTEAVAQAQAAGFPDVNNDVIGPFQGPENSIYYANKSGQISYFLPDRVTAFFGRVNAQGSPEFEYMLTPVGNFSLQNGMPVQMSTPPDVSSWPQSDAIVQAMIQALQNIQAGSANAVDPSVWQNQSVISSGLHNINMGILENMGSDGCTQHYEDTTYLGCW